MRAEHAGIGTIACLKNKVSRYEAPPGDDLPGGAFLAPLSSALVARGQL